jgi:energy-coupling factor transporter ATP-binding protein EcfA2
VISFDLIISNYRCFTAEEPARLEMRPGLTSLIGPNNSGKSAILRFFYEMRNLFGGISNHQTLTQLGRGNPQGFNAVGVGDALEIFHNRNNLPVRLEFRVKGAGANQLSGIDLTVTRTEPTTWRAAFRLGPDHEPLGANPIFPNRQLGNVTQQLNVSLLVQLGAELAGAMYLPATRVAIGEASGNTYDLQFGTSFIGLWDAWKTGPSRAQNDAIQRITDDIATLFGFRRLEITATPDNRDFHVAIDGKPFKLRELGSGLAQFMIVLANAGTRTPTWLLIDEPEISLHPSLQLDFLTTLTSYVNGGALFATHSLGLARSADRVFSVVKRDQRATLKPFESTGSLAEFLGEMSFAAYRELGFNTVLMVEGVNDIKTAQQFLRVLKSDHRVVVMHLGGSQMINPARLAELSEVLRLTRNVHVLIDSERAAAGQALAQNRRAFLDGCGELGIRALATDRRAFENYLNDRAVKIAFGDKYRALGEFEVRGGVNPVWAKADNWRAAREMSRDELLATDVGGFLQAL